MRLCQLGVLLGQVVVAPGNGNAQGRFLLVEVTRLEQQESSSGKKPNDLGQVYAQSRGAATSVPVLPAPEP